MTEVFPEARHGLGSVAEVADMIRAGQVLVLAGAEASLASLPSGRWIGGTAARFLTPCGGVAAAERILYTNLTDIAATVTVRRFGAGDIHGIGRHYPENGFAILIIPGFSPVLRHIAGHIADYDGLYNVPLTGWVSAVEVDALPGARPKCFAGGPQAQDNRAAVMYVTLPPLLFAQLHVVNLFSPNSGPDIRFPAGSQVTDGSCLIDGQENNLARYMAENNVDPRLPLIADHDGALLNVSILSANPKSGEVSFLTPVYPTLSYRFAEDLLDYSAEFTHAAAELELTDAVLSAVCVLNFAYAGLGEPRGLPFTAPATFGQIAYTVLNQTLTCLTIGRNEDVMAGFAP